MESEVELELLGRLAGRTPQPSANLAKTRGRTFSGRKSRPTASALRRHAIRKPRRLEPGVTAN